MSHTCLLIPSLAALQIDADAAGSSGGKRKASGASSASHWGLSSDSSARIALVALSRVMRAREDSVLAAAAASPAGAALLSALRAAVQRVAVAVGGASPQLGDVQVTSLFGMSGSTVANRRQYDGGLTLPSTLPWQQAKALLRALLDALNAARLSDNGARVATLLLQQPPRPMDAAGQAAIEVVVLEVEAAMTTRLGGGGVASSSSSSRSTPPPQPPVPAFPMPPPVPFALDAAQTLAANVSRLVVARLGRPLLLAETATIQASLDEGLSVLQAGGAAARQQLLNSRALDALANPGAAQLWACWLEAAESGVESVESLAAAAVAGCSSIAAVLFVAGVVF